MVAAESENEDEVWIGPALFCAMRSLNDAKYFPGDIPLEIESFKKPRKNNVRFLAWYAFVVD